MSVPVVTLEEFNALKDELNRKIQALEELLGKGSPQEKKWLKGKEFMKKFNIKHHGTLAGMIARKELKAVKRGKSWYYDVDSFLPS